MLLNLPFTKDKKEKALPYYAIELSDEMAKVAVWQLDEGVVSVIRTSEVIQVTGSKMNDYVQAVDMAIATVMVEGEPDPKEVLYGLPSEWVDNNGVVAQRRSLLKFISEKFVLKPIGFVIIIDALIEYLKIKQSTPPSAIFIRFRNHHLDIILVNLGKIIKTETVGRSSDVIADVKEGLVRLKKAGQFPARIILFDGYINFEDIKQQLMTVSWENELPFAQMPIIESLSRDVTVEAVVLSAGAEAISQNNPEASGAVTAAVPVQKTEELKNPVEESPIAAELPSGFSVGLAPETPAPIVNDEVISENNKIKTDPELEIETSYPDESLDTMAAETKAIEKINLWQKIRPKLNLNLFQKKTDPGNALERGQKTASQELVEDLEMQTAKKFPWWIWLVLALAVLIGLSSAGAWAFYNLPTATVKFAIKSQKVEQEVNFIIDPNTQELDENNLILPAIAAESSASGSQTVATTGTKKIGKSAQGKIIVYNKTDKPKTFGKDTVLVGPGNLRYILTDEVKVASSSTKMNSDNSEIKTYGEAEVGISAGDIGEEYNQTANQEFRFKDFGSDDFIAKNNEAITGGESTEIKAVAKADRTNASDLLTQALEAEATKVLQQELGDTLIVVDQTQTSDLEEITYDKKTGDQAEEITAEGFLTMSALAVNKLDFDRIVLKALASQIPQTHQPTSAGMQWQISKVEPYVADEETTEKDSKKTKDETEGKLRVSVKANVNIIPKLDFQTLKDQFKGKTPQVVEEIIKALPNYVSSDIKVHPNLPGPLGVMPSKTEKISVDMEIVD